MRTPENSRILCSNRASLPIVLAGLFLFCANALSATSVEVTVLTQTSKLLRTWTSEEMKKLQQKGRITSQRLIFDESTQTMDLNDRADIDLVTVYGKGRDGKPKVARVPRFMIWRDAFKLRFDSKTGELSSSAVPNPLKVPLELFEIRQIDKIELSQHGFVYPGTKLRVRTNPAASRGEKLFTQNCLACHSFVHPLDPAALTPELLKSFQAQHERIRGLGIDARDLRGLTAYSEALASEKTKVESPK